jgi:hypothetical protein
VFDAEVPSPRGEDRQAVRLRHMTQKKREKCQRQGTGAGSQGSKGWVAASHSRRWGTEGKEGKGLGYEANRLLTVIV